jgi:hypothetical protein
MLFAVENLLHLHCYILYICFASESTYQLLHIHHLLRSLTSHHITFCYFTQFLESVKHITEPIHIYAFPSCLTQSMSDPSFRTSHSHPQYTNSPSQIKNPQSALLSNHELLLHLRQEDAEYNGEDGTDRKRWKPKGLEHMLRDVRSTSPPEKKRTKKYV